MSFEVKQVDVSGTGYPISTATVVGGHLSNNDTPPWASFDYFPHELFPGLLPNCSTCPLHPELSQLRAESAYWRQMHQKAVARESRHKEDIAALKAKLRLRESQLFARKSEKNRNRPDLTITAVDTGNQPRGQQPGSQGHGRRSYSHLPTRVEVGDIPENNRYCPICDRPWVYSGSEDSETIEIEVSAYRRCYQRRRYRRTCTCQPLPQTVTAPAPAKLIPKGILGISVWVTILLDKFRFMRPTYRLLADLKTRGLDLALGTVTGGLQALAPLFIQSCSLLTIYGMLFSKGERHANSKTIAGRRS